MIDPVLMEEEAARQRADEMLLQVIDEREGTAVGGEADNVNVERATAIEYYLGRPFGNEIEGRSQVVSKDVFDTVEWIKPSLLRIFAGGDQVVEFQPQAEDDIEAAQQESDYVDYVIQRKNPWFMIAHEWFTDGLLTKNAYAMGYWEDKSEAVIERYSGLTDDQLALIGMDQTVQIVAHRAYQAPPPVPFQMSAMAQAISAPPMTLHDVDVRRARDYGCAKICVLPPERCLVATDAKGMSVREHSDFFEYWEYKSLSALRVMGFDVPDDISDIGGIEKGVVDNVRDSLTTQSFPGEEDRTADPSMRKVKARMIWVRTDYDGDGIAELRYVVAVGRNILVNREVPGIPVASIVPYPMPHRHIGLSLFDVLNDLQLIKSVLLRAGIDNQFLANNGRTAVDKNVVNLDDMLVSRPGGTVRVNGSPQTAIMPFIHPNTVSGTVQMIEYLDGIRQDRGGVSKPYAGADLESIKAQPGTIAQLTSAASQKIELIARIFGEGVKELFQIVHEITLSNPTVVEKVNLRGKWVTVDPRAWKKRSDMTLNVGMGVGNRQQQVAGLGALLGLQEKALAVGLTSPPKIYSALSKYVEALGFAGGKQFFDEPDPNKPFQPQTPPQILVAQINAQADVLIQQMKTNGDAQIATLREEAAAARTYFETMIDRQNKQQELFVRAVSEATDRMHEMRLEQARTGARISDLPEFQSSVSKINEASQTVQNAASQAAEHAKAAKDAADAAREAVSNKPRKAKIKAPSGKTYEVERTD